MHDERGRLLSEEPPESVERKGHIALVLGIAVILLGVMPLFLVEGVTSATAGVIFVVGLGVYIMYWSRISTPTRVFEGGVESFTGWGTRFVPFREMGNYYEHNGLVLHYYPEVRMGGGSSTRYRVHVPTSMPDYLWVVDYIKRTVDQNPDAHDGKFYVGTGPVRFRVR